jgi:hypothetical protein
MGVLFTTTVVPLLLLESLTTARETIRFVSVSIRGLLFFLL